MMSLSGSTSTTAAVTQKIGIGEIVELYKDNDMNKKYMYNDEYEKEIILEEKRYTTWVYPDELTPINTTIDEFFSDVIVGIKLMLDKVTNDIVENNDIKLIMSLMIQFMYFLNNRTINITNMELLLNVYTKIYTPRIYTTSPDECPIKNEITEQNITGEKIKKYVKDKSNEYIDKVDKSEYIYNSSSSNQTQYNNLIRELFYDVFYILSLFIFTKNLNFYEKNNYNTSAIMKIYNNYIIKIYIDSRDNTCVFKVSAPYYAYLKYYNIIINKENNWPDWIDKFVYYNNFVDNDIFLIIIYTFYKCIELFRRINTGYPTDYNKMNEAIHSFLDFVFILLFMSLKYKRQIKENNIYTIQKIILYIVSRVQKVQCNRNNPEAEKIYKRITAVYDTIYWNIQIV